LVIGVLKQGHFLKNYGFSPLICSSCHNVEIGVFWKCQQRIQTLITILKWTSPTLNLALWTNPGYHVPKATYFCESKTLQLILTINAQKIEFPFIHFAWPHNKRKAKVGKTQNYIFSPEGLPKMCTHTVDSFQGESQSYFYKRLKL
jgi:hypothetical protein